MHFCFGWFVEEPEPLFSNVVVIPAKVLFLFLYELKVDWEGLLNWCAATSHASMLDMMSEMMENSSSRVVDSLALVILSNSRATAGNSFSSTRLLIMSSDDIWPSLLLHTLLYNERSSVQFFL